MAESKKIDLKGTLNGLKSLATRNAVLAILLNITNQYTNNMRTSFRSLIGNSIGLSGTAIGLAFSIFTIAAMLMRTPSGAVADNKRDKIKYILAGGFVAKAVVFAAFAFVKTPAMYYAVYIIDGALYSFITTLVPVILACSVDRKAMGSAYALYMGLMQVAISTARSFSVSIFNTEGQTTVALITAALSLTSVMVALCLDGSKLYVKRAAKKEGVPVKKKGILAGLNMAMLPLAICCGLCIFPNTIDGNFTVLRAEAANFEYLGALTLGQTIYGVMSIVTGFLCDIVSPAILIIISLVGMIAGFGLMGIAATSTTFCTGIMIYQICRYWNSPFKIIGMKAVANSEQGSFQATMLLVTDVVTIFASTLAGMVADAMGYSGAYLLTVGVLAVNLILFLALKKSGKINERATVD
ncbi:MFS transporter [Enterocloster asparagiformis]|uniref:MFS transporter n=1 Tax=Enterocloster asparagiformis TaxID=333367 RepID=UPI002A7FA34C|nr:MFS transporter [Enterocloster asparagiformis]